MIEENVRRQWVTPALVVDFDQTQANLQKMVELAGSPARLRPHCKTHKMPAVVRLWLELGVTRHKCATLAEAEMLATAGAEDILLAYNIVGANIERVVAFRRRFPQVRLTVLVDHPQPLRALSEALRRADQHVSVMLDVETGLRRTGVPPGEAAIRLYRAIHEDGACEPAGLHWYDGHLHQRDRSEREAAVISEWETCRQLRAALEAEGLPVPTIVAGGTGTFPIYAGLSDAGIELSPGTCVFHDAGYEHTFPDLPFTPSARLLTRVISRPTARRITLDAGTKAVAADPPHEKRIVFPDLPDARIVLHNEEHLGLETDEANRFSPGDELLGIPWHICPTSALHREAIVVRHGLEYARWVVAARDRQLTI